MKEEDHEEKHISRNLTSVLLGDKIVCAGYSEIFKAVITKLGYINDISILQNTNPGKFGHARNIVMLDDEKYQIEGIYFFDLTWDSKKNNDENSFLTSYDFFAKTKNELEFRFPNLIEKRFGNFTELTPCQFLEAIEKNGTKGLSRELMKAINEVAYFVKNDRLIEIGKVELIKAGIKMDYPINSEEIFEELNNYVDLFDNRIMAETYLDAIFVVRSKEYLEDPEKYPFDMKTFLRIVSNSNWFFSNDGEGILLESLLGDHRPTKDATIKGMKKYIETNSLEDKINNIIVTNKGYTKKYEY